MTDVLALTIRRDQIRALLTNYLATTAVLDNAGSLAGDFDQLIERCLESDEPELALTVYTALHLSHAGLSADSAALLATRLMQAQGSRAAAHDLLVALGEPREVRACRKCGCTQFRACPGGCRWVEDDLCSRCATWPLPACIKCNAPAPVNMEDAYRQGWAVSGVCPRCQRNARFPR